MDPSATHRFRRTAATAVVAWALLALGLSLSAQLTGPGAVELPFDVSVMGGLVNVYQPGPRARAAGVAPGDRVLRVDGVPALEWLRDLGLAGLVPGRPNTYELERGNGERLQLALAPGEAAATPTMAQPLYLALLGVGLAYLVIGVGVWRLRPHRADAFALLLVCGLMAAQLFVSVDAWRAWRGIERLLVTLPLLGAAVFHLFTLPPLAPGWMVRHHRARWVPYAGAGVIAAAALVGGVVRVPVEAVSMAAFYYTSGLALASFGVLAWTRRTAGHDPVQAARADVLYGAALVSFVPVIGLLLAQVLAGLRVPLELAMLWLLVFPLLVAWGLVRRELFDLRAVARSSVAYGVASLFVTAAFAVLVIAADTAVARLPLRAGAAWVPVALLFLAILAFDPLRHAVQRVVDRVFDRDRVGHRHAVGEISEALAMTTSPADVAARILTLAGETIGVERAMVLLADREGSRLRPVAVRGDWDRDAMTLELALEHPLVRRAWVRRGAVSRADFDEEDDREVRFAAREAFDRLGVDVLVPILFGVDVLGLVAVGRRLGGERLRREDLQLLGTLANQGAVAIENARAFGEIEHLNATLEARVAARSRELAETQDQLVQSEKLKSLGGLVAGIAHELNNPIGFVHANLDLLRGYVRRLLAADLPAPEAARLHEAVARLLSRSREGTERVKRIVEDLRVFSRPDRAELQDADLNQEIDRTLTLMDPRLRNAVRVARDYAELPRVRCHPGQLGQVFLNLLMNACDALRGRGEIRIRTRRGGRGVVLEFEDDGPGIPPEVRGRIFEPFYTTKPEGAGTGLGLSLSHGIVQRHGGVLRAEESASGGARFVVELPLRAPEAAPA